MNETGYLVMDLDRVLVAGKEIAYKIQFKKCVSLDFLLLCSQGHLDKLSCADITVFGCSPIKLSCLFVDTDDGTVEGWLDRDWKDDPAWEFESKAEFENFLDDAFISEWMLYSIDEEDVSEEFVAEYNLSRKNICYTDG